MTNTMDKAMARAREIAAWNNAAKISDMITDALAEGVRSTDMEMIILYRAFQLCRI